MKDVREQLLQLLAERILVLDGAWGVLIHRRGLTEEEYRGERFAAHTHDVKGDPDLLNLTAPEIVAEIHDAYFEAGADIATTNTFTATSIGQADYALEGAAAEMSLEGARLARAAADAWTARTPDKPRFVAGSVGPLNVTLSLSPKVEDAAFRAVTFDAVQAAYEEQIRALRDGGVDLLLIETIFDTLNAKAAIVAAQAVAPELPLWLSFTAIDRSGRNLSGQTSDAFWISVEHAEPFIVGVNCSLGATEMRPFLEGSRGRRVHVRLVPSERRAPECARAPRRASGGHEPLPAGVRGGRPRQPRRRLLRDDAGAHACDRPSCGGAAAAPCPVARHQATLLRPRSVRDRPRHRVRRRGRADERDRVGAFSPADRGERLPGCRRRRARAGARRGESARREHGRRPARRRAGDDDLPQPPRHRARGCPSADHGRQLALLRARGRPSLPAGQGRRQLDLAEGGRGAVPRAGADDSPVRRRGRGHGLRRARAGGHRRAQGGDSRPRVRPRDDGGRLRARRRHPRSQHPRGGDRDRGARGVREGVHRRDPAPEGALPGRARLGRRSRTSRSRFAATTPSARRCTRRSSTTRSARGSTWGS